MAKVTELAAICCNLLQPITYLEQVEQFWQANLQSQEEHLVQLEHLWESSKDLVVEGMIDSDDNKSSYQLTRNHVIFIPKSTRD